MFRPTGSKIPLDSNEIISNLQRILLAEEHHSTDDEYYLQQNILHLQTKDYADLNQAYYLLNDYFVESNSKQTSSTFSPETLNALKAIYEDLSHKEELNWFGISNPAELAVNKLYGGESQFSQRMQHLILTTAKRLTKARTDILQQEKTFNFDKQFLSHYLNGKLSPHAIQQLDELEKLLWERSSDFVTITTACHLYRAIISFKNLGHVSFSNMGFFSPRTYGMALKNLHPEVGREFTINRLTDLLPEGKLKDLYLTVPKPRKKITENFFGHFDAFFKHFFTTDRDSHARSRAARTPLFGHYEQYLQVIYKELRLSEQLSSTKLYCFTQKGLLPDYETKRLKPVEFSTTIICKREESLEGIIHNKPIDTMVKDHDEEWPGYTIYKHIGRLYTIALLTHDQEVAEEARRRLEWWYSNVMPYGRGTASISEALSKSLLLSRHIIPTRMGGVLPDLRAICQYNEQQFVENYSTCYPSPQYRFTPEVNSLASLSSLGRKYNPRVGASQN